MIKIIIILHLYVLFYLINYKFIINAYLQYAIIKILKYLYILIKVIDRIYKSFLYN